MSLGYLLGLAQQLHSDVGQLAKKEEETPSLGLSAQIELRDEKQRAAFMEELQETIQQMAEKYGSREGDRNAKEESQSYRLMLACYPHEKSLEDK